MSKSVPSLIHVSLDLRQFKTGLPSARSGSDKTLLIINTNKCFTLPFLGQIKIFSVIFFPLEASQFASSSHDANLVLAAEPQ